MTENDKPMQREVKLSLSSWIAIFTAGTTLLGGLGFSISKSVLGSSESPEIVRVQKDLADLSRQLMTDEKQITADERMMDKLQFRVQSLERAQGYDSSDAELSGYQKHKRQ